MSAMMTELWWKVFLASLITVGVAKFFRCRMGMLLLFALAYIGWAIGLLLLLNLHDSWIQWRMRPKNRR